MDNETIVKQIRTGQDIKKNMENLYAQNKGMIYKTVKKFRYIDSMTDIEDLMQQAYIYLAYAVDHYNFDGGASFLTYAIKVISTQMKQYIDNTGRIMRIPIHIQEKAYKYNQVTSHFLSQFDRMPTDKEYCWYMDITQKQLESLRRTMRITAVESIEKHLADDLTIGDTIVDPSADMESVERTIDQERLTESLWDAVKKAVSDSKDIQVIEDRYKRDCTLRECGEHLGVTTEAARTRESRAMRKLRSNRRIREIGEAEGIAPRKTKGRRNYRSMTWADLTDIEREYISMCGVM